jgi:hypothetical protein
MNLHEMAKLCGVSFSKVHAAACQVYGGKLPPGRRKWSKEQEDAIKVIVDKEA